MTLSVITAVLIGGVSLLGGLGTTQGVVVGSILLSLIDNALVLTEVPPTLITIMWARSWSGLWPSTTCATTTSTTASAESMPELPPP
jgi:ABC-type branched-subunit amino acid transport system permease subunit